MYTLVDSEYYNLVYYYAMFFFIGMCFLYFVNNNWNQKTLENFTKLLGIPFLIMLLIYVGFRPIYIASGDMPTYLSNFNDFENSFVFNGSTKDVAFYAFMWLCSKFMNTEYFFFTLTAIYILCVYFACKKWFNTVWFIPFLFFVITLEFYSYGINGIRNGVATSIFIFAISRTNFFVKLVLFYLVINIHRSAAIPCFAYLISFIYFNPKYYVLAWLACIPLSFQYGSFFEEQFQLLFPEDNTVTEYFQKGWYDDKFSSIGFRWDFIIYSGIGVALGAYYTLKLKFNDVIYNRLFGTYLATNALWILLIAMSYSNRMAYLSWCILGLVIAYPLVKTNFLKKQSTLVAVLMLGYFLITFYINSRFF